MKNAMTKCSAVFAENELDGNALDEVVGGSGRGIYGSIGYTGLESSGSVTIAVGGQSSFPFVTGGFYKTSGDGVSSGISAGVSGGVFHATGNADSYFLGHGTAGALAVNAVGELGVEWGHNPSGDSFGVTRGVGIGIDGVQASWMETVTTPVFSSFTSGGATFNMNSSGPGVPTNSPQEYGGYLHASQSPPLDRYEPNSPELNSAINAINASHTDDPGHIDPGHTDDPGHAHEGQTPTQETSGTHTDDPGHTDTQAPADPGHTDAPGAPNSGEHGASQDASPDHSYGDGSHGNDGYGNDTQGMNDSSYFGNDYGDSNFGGGDFGGSDFA